MQMLEQGITQHYGGYTSQYSEFIQQQQSIKAPKRRGGAYLLTNVIGDHECRSLIIISGGVIIIIRIRAIATTPDEELPSSEIIISYADDQLGCIIHHG